MTIRAWVLSAALAGVTSAQDSGRRDAAPIGSPAVVAPVISAVTVDGQAVRRARLGRVVYLIGQFPAPDAEGRGLVVEVDDRPVEVLSGSQEHLEVRLPGDASALGLARVRVTRPDGARAETELGLFTEGLTHSWRNGLALTHLFVSGRRARGAAPGDTLELSGRGWPTDRPDGARPPGLSVSLSGRELLLAEATLGRLVVRIPDDVPPDATTLRVQVQREGELHALEVPLALVDPTWGAAGAPCPADVGPPADPMAPASRFELSFCGPVRDEAGARIQAKGAAPQELPDGCAVQVTFCRNGRALRTLAAVIRSGAWSASLDPVEELEPGRYEVVASFELVRQRMLVKELMSRILPGRWTEFAQLERRRSFTVEGR